VLFQVIEVGKKSKISPCFLQEFRQEFGAVIKSGVGPCDEGVLAPNVNPYPKGVSD
jgi:hypothetical protein